MEQVAKNKSAAHLTLDTGDKVLPMAPPGYAYAVGPKRGGYCVLQPVELPKPQKQELPSAAAAAAAAAAVAAAKAAAKAMAKASKKKKKKKKKKKPKTASSASASAAPARDIFRIKSLESSDDSEEDEDAK